MTKTDNQTVNFPNQQCQTNELSVESNNSISIFHINKPCISNKTHKFSAFCKDNNLDLLCVSEYWQVEYNLKKIIKENYNFLTSSCRSKSKHVGYICLR